MKTFRLMALVAAFVAAIALSIGQAEAARVGGGKSSGKQQPNAMQRDAGAPAGQQASSAAQRPGQPAAAPATQPQGNRWLGPLAGLAAGLGLAALASHFGFGEGLANIMLIVLLAVVALVVIRMIMARRSGTAAQPAYAGASSAPSSAEQTAASSQNNSLFSPVSEPASAPLAGGAGPVGAGSAPASTGLRVPANFDITGFVRNAKLQFVRLQASFDAANLNDLREFTTPEMFAELSLEIEERKGQANVTEVVSVEAEFLGVDSNSVEHMASVRFYGVIREAVGAPAQSFDEIWNLVKPIQGAGGWVLAGIQQTEAPAA